MPNNWQTNWMCSSCKANRNQHAVSSTKTDVCKTPDNQPTTCAPSSPQSQTNSNHAVPPIIDDIQDSSDDEPEFIKETKGNIDKLAPIGDLTQQHFDIIMSSDGYLDCTIIQQAQILLKKVNPGSS